MTKRSPSKKPSQKKGFSKKNSTKKVEKYNFQALSLSQKILLTTDGTVTDMLSLLTGEPIRITKLPHSTPNSDIPKELELEQCADVMSREILLTGHEDNYIYAKSLFVISRMSQDMQDKLLETDTPIGLLWKQEKLETYREIISQGIELCPELREYFPFTDSDDFLCRTYTVRHNQKPIGIITEKFPLAYFE
ncbi:MAG: chorismate--pyruvate lyase family protein [Cellvibrionaceae bacterium]